MNNNPSPAQAMTVDEYIFDLTRRADERRKNPPRPNYREYTVDSKRIVSKNGIFERPRKNKIKGLGFKVRLMYCKTCKSETKHGTPFIGYPFTCVLNHNGKTLCNCCDTYTDTIAKIVMDIESHCYSFCDLCVQEKTPKFTKEIVRRRNAAHKERRNPDILKGGRAMARALGASSFR